MNNHKKTDILIIGAGLSGLVTGLILSKKYKVTLITKQNLDKCSTAWAQGGIAAALSSSDNFEKHIEDTIKNGHGLVDEDVSRLIIQEAPNCIRWLEENGIVFSRHGDEIDLGLEGGHSERRIAHIRDETGKIIHKKLSHIVKLNNNIEIIENSMAIDLIIDINQKVKTCLGAYVFDCNNKSVTTISAKNIIISTGGASKVYQYTSNPNTSTGDGIAMAWRAGCTIANMEFVQFHPTCIYHPLAKSFLISEALRGEGGKLLSPSSARFMKKYDERQELASRDIVARAIDYEMKKYGYTNVLLDISHKSASFIKRRFPLIYKKCNELGIDITKEAIPVVPASHYTCGGVQAKLNGQTEINNLYVIGEAAHTGFHGANRLASNSLLECLVMSKMCSESICNISDKKSDNNSLRLWNDSYVTDSKENIMISHNWDELRKIMWNYVGIVRSDKRLTSAKIRLKIIEDEVNDYYHHHKIDKDLLELRNIIEISSLIIDSALSRKESRGLHYSIDYPLTKTEYKKNTLIHGKRGDYFMKLVHSKV